MLQFNINTKKETAYLKVNVHLDKALDKEIEELFLKYKDVFIWPSKDFMGILPFLAQHCIELEKNVPLVHQACYQFNLNYISIIKYNIDKLLKASFIKLVEQATWLSSIVIIPMKNGKLHICTNYMKFNIATKKDPYPLSFIKEVLDVIARLAMYTFLDCCSRYYQI